MNRATHTTVAVLGTVAGMAGVEHGIGEIRQAMRGGRDPGALVIESWPDTPAFALLGGEPAMTVLPDLLWSGILAILLSLAFIVWAIWFTPRKHGGLGLMAISVALLLVGGGFGPPLIGLILGAAATRINAPLVWWRRALPAGARRPLAAIWPWSLGLCVLTWLLSFPGMVLLAYLGGVQESNVMFVLGPAMFVCLFLTIAAAFARDAERLGGLSSIPRFAL